MDEDHHALVRRISAGLHDQHNPVVCPACVIELYSLLLEDPEAHAAVLRRHHPTMLSAMTAWVARADPDGAPLTDQLHESLRSCSSSDDEEHGVILAAYSSNPTSEVHYRTVISVLCFIVMTSLDFTPHALWKRKFKRRTWPAGVDDLVPNGESDCRGLLFWFDQMDDPQVFGTFIMVFLLCRTTFYPIVSVDPGRSTLVEAICRYLVQYATELRSPHSNECISVVQMRWLTMLLSFIRKLGDGEWPQWRRIFRGFESQLLSCITYADGAQLDESTRWELREFALAMHASLGVECLCCIPRGLAVHAFEKRLEIGGPFGHLLRLIETLPTRGVCEGPRCPTSHEGVPFRLFLCGSCTTLRYCSRQCQRDHWQMARHPHKPACQQLREIKTASTPGMDVEQFKTACASIGFGLRQLVPLFANLMQISRIQAIQGKYIWLTSHHLIHI
ncbi:hypothetical protein AURDEDRAFT_128888 [Auricularia subglabra TFB-10046 SS5]|nr:hypothetical protein AURDEDRAFT_128888 [Auricularia subglabra TFB-10046 SS5]